MHGSEFFLQRDGPGASFGYLSRNIQRFFRTGVAPYPPERTLLATGIIDAVMNSRYEGHRVVETPYLDVAYESYDEMPIRPNEIAATRRKRGPKRSGRVPRLGGVTLTDDHAGKHAPNLVHLS